MPTDHGPQCHIHTFLDHLQGQCLHNLPAQPVPMYHHSFAEIFPNNFTEGFTTPTLIEFKVALHSRATNGVRTELGFTWTIVALPQLGQRRRPILCLILAEPANYGILGDLSA